MIVAFRDEFKLFVVVINGHCDYKSMKPYIDIAGLGKSDAMIMDNLAKILVFR